MRNQLFTLALGSLLTLGVSSAAFAQDTPPPQSQGQPDQGPGRGPGRMNPDRQLERMTSELGLSADQQAQIKPLLVDRQQKMQALFQDQSLAPEDRRAKMQAIRQDSQSKIATVLNDQQKQMFASMQDRPHHNRGEGAPPPDGVPPQPQL